MAEGARDAASFAPGQSGKLKVFISYSRDDLDFADQLAAGLELCGFEATIDRHEISGGEAWRQRLGNMIRDADTIAFVLSPSSAVSDVCAWEVNEAAKNNKRILPIVCQPLRDVAAPPQLGELNYIFFYQEPDAPGSGFGSGLAHAVSALNTDLEWVREHTRLLARATEWDKGARHANRLLAGGDIVDAKAWAARRPKDAPALTALHLDFIRASETEEASRANAERARLDEMAQAQDARAKALREAEEALKRAEDAQRATNRARTAIALVSATAALVAVVIAAYAINKRNIAKEQEAIAAKLLKESQIQRASAFISFSDKFAESGDQATRLLMILEALPDIDENERTNWPILRNAKSGLEKGLRNLREYAVFEGSGSLSPDGAIVLVTSKTKAVPRLYETATGSQLRTLGDKELSVDQEIFSRDGARVLLMQTKSHPQLWDVATGKLLFNLRDPRRFAKRPRATRRARGTGPSRRWRAEEAGISADGQRIFTMRDGRAPLLWDGMNGALITTLPVVEGFRTTASFSRDGRRLLTVTSAYAGPETDEGVRQIGRVVALWDAATGEKINEIVSNAQVHIASARFSPKGNSIIVKFGSVPRIFDGVNGEERFKPADAGEQFDQAVFSPDDSSLLTASGDGRLRIWDPLKPDTPRVVLFGQPEALAAAAFSSDGTQLFTASAERSVIWDSATGNVLRTFPTADASIVKASLSKDGRFLLATYREAAPRVWNTSTGATGTVGTSPVTNASLSPDGEWVLTPSTGTVVNLWATAKIIGTTESETDFQADDKPTKLGGHRESITSSEFSPDGSPFLLTNSNDGTARLWRVNRELSAEGAEAARDATGNASYNSKVITPETLRSETLERIKEVRGKVPRCLLLDQRMEYAMDATPPEWCFMPAHRYPYNVLEWSGWPNVAANQDVARFISHYAGEKLLDQDHRTALAATKLSLKFDPQSAWLRINHAHALMYSGDITAAREIYASNRGADMKPYSDSWDDMLLKDFEDLRNNGLEHTPLTQEIEKLYKTSPPPGAQPVPVR